MEKIVEMIVAKIEETGKGLFFGIRSLTDDESYEVGDICRNSYEYDEYNQCSTYFTNGLECEGTCATGGYVESYDDAEDISEMVAKWLDINYDYDGDKQVLIFGEDEGDYISRDDQEVRIEYAEVLAYI